ncbi:MAG: P1 family peptidase [Candidatus Heimdallarchaeota archaeon]|nr:P1 family peptidase [Candidatus Heimdallarchaeota archaeon]
MTRARDLGIPFNGIAGKYNSITDVEGVEVGHSTIIKGDGTLVVGEGPVRTGVTVIFPVGKKQEQVYGAYFSFNGNGEMTGTHWVEETGLVTSPICITNTHSVGIVRDSIVEWKLTQFPQDGRFRWILPIVAETYDGVLNDINGFHITKDHLMEAINSSRSPNTDEGNIGGGTGMICHQFKGGIGTSSRICQVRDQKYTVGALVQANYGMREDLTIAGVPVGKELSDLKPKINPTISSEQGSIIVIIGTDAPLLPHQLKRLCKRIIPGLGRVGGYGGNSSGDIFLAFSTANKFNETKPTPLVHEVESLEENLIDPIFKGVAEATEEAIINAIVAAKDMTGINGNTVYAIPHDRLVEIIKNHSVNLNTV